MKDISHEIALIVCKQTKRLENENNIDFSKRLYSVYKSCQEAIVNITNEEDTNFINNSVENTLKIDGR